MMDILTETKLKITSVLVQATKIEPPHLVDIGVVNPQKLLVWFTIEPYEIDCETVVQGWDPRRGRFYSFNWGEVAQAYLNSKTYQRVNDKEWQRRMLETNIQYIEENTVKQSKGIYWR